MAIESDTRDSVSVGSSDEPVFFPASDKTYFGILSVPDSVPWNDTAVVLLSGTFGGTTTVGRNRMWVKLARRLAGLGIPVLRFDYAGLGDSVGEMVCYELETPAVPELHAAFDMLASRGIERFIVVGTCYGSRTALAGSVGESRVAGVHLLAPPVRSGTKGSGGAEHLAEHHGSAALAKQALQPRNIKKLAQNKRSRTSAKRVVKAKLRSFKRRVSSAEAPQHGETKEAAAGFHRPLRKLLSEGVPVRLLFGTDDFFWTQFEEASSLRLGEDLERYPDLVEVETVPGMVRGFLSLRVQQIAIDSVVDSVMRWAS